MFKKISMFVLLCMSVGMLSACNESTTEKLVFVSPTIEGTYNVTYFGTATTPWTNFDLVITDSCSMSTELRVITSPSQTCSQTSAMTGEVVISKNDNGTLKIVSKIQMAGGFVELSPTDKFQYTEYYSVMPAENRLSGAGVGMTGYNLDEVTGELSATPIEFADSPFEFYLTGSELTIKMTLKNKETIMGAVDAVTTVKAKKISDAVTPLDKKRFWTFDADDATVGMYDITLFATESEGKVLSNDCALAIANGFANAYNCVGAKPTMFKGQVAVEKDEYNTFNMAQIYAKVQMSGGFLDNPEAVALKYMYFNYAMLPGLMKAKGVTVTFFDKATQKPSNDPKEFKESTFEVNMSDDNRTMTIKTIIKDEEVTVDGTKIKLNAKTFIKATKTSDVYTDLPDELFQPF